ncbi:transposase [Clostridium algidicarnis]|uniref:transposase n=1 Tax=Clostridium algidicarnis TaxID=37659 RepID=UPI003C6CAA35
MFKGSNNYRKARVKLAKIHEKIANQRIDFLHKESLKIINENQVIILEDLNVKSMM